MTEINWKGVAAAYEYVKAMRANGDPARIEGENFKVYHMGNKNPVIRIDIKVTEPYKEVSECTK